MFNSLFSLSAASTALYAYTHAPARSQEKKGAELRRKSNTGKISKLAAAAAAPAGTRARHPLTLAPAPARATETPDKDDTRGPVETVGLGSPGDGVGPRQEMDVEIAPLLPLSALSDPLALLGPPPRDVDGSGNSAQKKVLVRVRSGTEGKKPAIYTFPCILYRSLSFFPVKVCVFVVCFVPFLSSKRAQTPRVSLLRVPSTKRPHRAKHGRKSRIATIPACSARTYA